jgi:dTDP-4-amino-4,6-dideoxygalactose transaminase
MPSKRKIPFFNYPALFAVREKEIMETVHRVFASGKLIMQEDLESFERNLATFLGTKHVIGVANGTDSIMFGLMAAGIGKGDEVILPSHTFIATGSAVHFSGATPVLVDCLDDHMIDPDAVRRAISPRTRAIVPVQLNGRTAQMDRLMALATERSFVVIEDSAQALGAKFMGRNAGTFGKAGSFSFYPAKLLGCYGDGGCVVTDDEELASIVRSLRDHGRTPDGDVRGWSFNSRLDNVQAALLDLKLKTLQRDIERRREIASMYQERLGEVDDLLLPPGPDSDSRYFDVFQNYEVESASRDELRRHLAEEGVGTIIQWGGKGIHQLPRLGFDVSLPITERVMERSLLLPMNTSLSDDDVLYICDKVASFSGVHV